MAVTAAGDGWGASSKESGHFAGETFQGYGHRSAYPDWRCLHGERVRPYAIPDSDPVSARPSRISASADAFWRRAMAGTGAGSTRGLREGDVRPWASLGRQPASSRRPSKMLEPPQAGRL